MFFENEFRFSQKHIENINNFLKITVMTSSEPTMNGDAYPDDLCEGQTKTIYIQIKNCFEENSKHNIQSGKAFFFI